MKKNGLLLVNLGSPDTPTGIGRLTSDPYLEAWRSLSGSWFEDLEPQWLWIPED